MNATEYVQKSLFSLKDERYADFQRKLMPSVSPDKVIGVRMPAVRAFSKQVPPEIASDFLRSLPHEYYDENNVHASLIERVKDYDECVRLLDAFLPYVDNWATCDMMSPKAFAKAGEKLLFDAKRWAQGNGVYEIRFGIEILMNYFSGERFTPDLLDVVASVKSDEYYVNMMIAWYFATLLAKQYEFAVKVIERGVLDEWTHNKAIQKAVESYRLTQMQKEYLKSLKR